MPMASSCPAVLQGMSRHCSPGRGGRGLAQHTVAVCSPPGHFVREHPLLTAAKGGAADKRKTRAKARAVPQQRWFPCIH